MSYWPENLGWGLGAVTDDIKAVGEQLTQVEKEVEGAQNTLRQAENVATKATSVAEDMFLFFSSWSGGKITVPHLTKAGTTPVYSRVYTQKEFVDAVANGAQFHDPDWAAFGFTRPFGVRPKGMAWNMVTAVWEPPTSVGATFQVKPEQTVNPTPAYPSIGALASAQKWVNAWAGATAGWTRVSANVSAAISMANWPLAVASPGSSYTGQQGLWSMISMLTSQPIKTALTAGMSVTAGSLAGTPFKTLYALWVTQATALLAKVPKTSWPQNAGMLAVATANVPGAKFPGAPSQGGEGAGAAAAGLGVLGLLFMLFRMFR